MRDKEFTIILVNNKKREEINNILFFSANTMHTEKSAF